MLQGCFLRPLAYKDQATNAVAFGQLVSITPAPAQPLPIDSIHLL
jgi:hypothetical protein